MCFCVDFIAHAKADAVNVKLFFIKYSANHLVSQGVSWKKNFFGNYSKTLCKQYYVNLVNLEGNNTFRNQKQQYVVSLASLLCPYLFPPSKE